PQRGYNISVEEAHLSFHTPGQLGIRYKELNYPFKVTIGEADNIKRYQWDVKGLSAIVSEPSGPHYLDIFPAVLLSPNEIIYEGFAGDFSSWKSYGKWSYDLNAGRQELPPSTVEEVKRIVQPIADKKEKVRAIYQYMQRKTRYVNITLGIGGWQPFPAAEVDEKGYGDCKALSNYMKALLKSVGIESLYTIIGSGQNVKIKFPDFPGNGQANHIILCVPLEQDTVWLECTNQTIPFGYISSANTDRHCLLVKPEGGVLVRTPDYPAEKNRRSSTISASLVENGGASFACASRFSNYMFEEVFGMMSLSRDEQKKALLNGLSASGLAISDFSLSDISDKQAEASLAVKGNISSYSVRAGGRLFVQPNFLFKNSFPEKISRERKYSLCEEIGFNYQDTLNLILPDQLTLEFMPENVALSSIYGSFEITYSKVQDNQVMIIRSVRIKKGEYDKSKFAEINSFLMNIAKREKEKLVLTAKS
ncbi:MAG: transglutaminase domain-containing protein, partial [Prolixibacteraceae bacterium]